MQATPPADDREPIAFMSFHLDRRGGRLTRAGEAIPLRPKTWAVLLYLAERPGVLVTRGELLDAVWPNVAVTPDTLTKSIGELRLALGDDSRTPRCIETVHRRGFRFIGAAGTPGASQAAAHTWRHQGAAQRTVVGRESELEQLSLHLAKACSGERQIVFVTGPAGVGKTTLVEAFMGSTALRGAAAPVWIGHGACVEQHGAREPYMPVLEALERLLRRPESTGAVGLLRHTAPTWLAQMPWLLGDDEEALRQSLQAARPERMLREFAVLTEALSAGAPVVLVIEDLHWSDPSTVDLLAVLAQRREAARLLVIGTYRPAEVAVQAPVLSQTVRALHLHRQCSELAVHELTTEDVQHYLDERFQGAEFAEILAPTLHHYTDGNPLFVAAVVEHMVSRGWILDTAPGWALSAPPDKLQLEVPDDARHMIQMQLEGLSPADRALVEAASVVGTEFPVQAVAAALQVDVQDIERRCEALTRASGLVRIAGTTEWPDGSVAQSYAFRHELYRQAAYGEIPEGQRRRLHRRIGAALEASYGDRATEVAGELAVHFGKGRDHGRALQYLAAAATRARQRFAGREAIGYLEAAIALLAQLPDPDEQRRRELTFRLALAPVLNDLHGFASEALRENCERAYALCAQVGGPEQRFQIVYALCHLYAVRADAALTPKLLAELEELAERLGTANHRLFADSLTVRVATGAGRFIEACRVAEQRLPAPQRGKMPDAPFAYGADPLIAANCHYAFALWMRGHTTRARTMMRASLAAARRGGSPFSLVAALWFSAVLEFLCRNHSAARDVAEQAADLATEQGFAFWSALAAGLRGAVQVQKGELGAGIAELEHARVAHAATGAWLFSTHIFCFLAEAHLRAGNAAAGLAAVDEGLMRAESSLDRSYWPELWRIKGELLLAAAVAPTPHTQRGGGKQQASAVDARWQEAERCLLRAVDLARKYEAKSLELRAATSLAHAWQGSGRTEEARALLSNICKWFGDKAESVDLAEARTLLRQVPPASRSRAAHHASRTRA
jgi:DNA-binding winged helix-turn-helix (wHTH) protein